MQGFNLSSKINLVNSRYFAQSGDMQKEIQTHRPVRTPFTGIMVCICGKLFEDCKESQEARNIQENEARAFNFRLAARNDEY